MAVWIENPQKQKQIEDYFSSMNGMSLRIVEDVQKIRQNYGKSWDRLSVEDQERRIDENLIPDDVRKHYPLPETKGPDLFPTYRINTGQKIVELPSDTGPNEIAATWRDEHSDPFSFETKSQMELTLPMVDEKELRKRMKKKSSLQSEILNQNSSDDGARSASKGGFASSAGNKESTHSEPKKDHACGGTIIASNNSGNGRETNQNSNKALHNNGANATPDSMMDMKLNVDYTPNYGGERYDFGGAPSKASDDLPDINFDAEFLKSCDSLKRNLDVRKVSGLEPVTLLTSGISKAYDESEFLDLYPQPKKTIPKPAPPQEVVTKPKSKSQKLKKSSKSSGKFSYLENAQDTSTTNPGLSASTKLRKTHSKKSSSGSSQVNPRSSLTLDGAIHNLEIAAEINKQGASPQVRHDKVFSDEFDLLQQIERNTDLENWLTDSSATHNDLSEKVETKDTAGDKGPQHKSGFAFLDNW